MSSHRYNNSGIDELDLSNLSLLGKYIKTNLGNEGKVIEEWLCYPEPSEWLLDNGYVFTEWSMHSTGERIIEIDGVKVND